MVRARLSYTAPFSAASDRASGTPTLTLNAGRTVQLLHVLPAAASDHSVTAVSNGSGSRIVSVTPVFELGCNGEHRGGSGRAIRERRDSDRRDVGGDVGVQK